ncbi:formyl transferase [Pseudomonas sp. MAP12]|uniref:phosphoribosylglycinamide formyltransferase 1 n=1 Tax=Geopseudomonas aromaticivorans TaxID=2849492 RepID=A0ABS6MVY9_9GAMM|nr:formyl transferase [Pseudomonas aromaticivorans]MBV2132967.1 formyl transferase [Pseudomonas aromaticivorans]
MESPQIRVAMLCGNGRSSRILYNSLATLPGVQIACVILENSPPALALLRGRVRKLGAARVAGQLLFMVYNRLHSRASAERIRQLMTDYDISDAPFPAEVPSRVDSINNPETIDLLAAARPDVVLVNGTRIIAASILSAIACPVINTHMGITPRYRGVHGGYWALARGDRENCGVTVHLIDPGIDTGGVLYQDIIHPESRDNFNTYPIHQMARAIPLIEAALDDIRHHQIQVKPGVMPSMLWSHPTLFEYLGNWVRSGAK